ncbi:hypothetical protein OEA41_010753 [Lepraria neglecta]|uniref:Uncharacterized protein n=1 Tax=Lepraria neglecta TaxID=209136 RepID=A0AAD9YX80_9LECA|nr:hypothetical protein OEA41_010753 [Lepraria neglecta]
MTDSLDVFHDFVYAEQHRSGVVDPIISHNTLRETTQPIHTRAPSWQHTTPAEKILQEWNAKLEDQNKDEVDTSLKDDIDSCKSLPNGSHDTLRATTQTILTPVPSWQHATPAEIILEEWNVKLEDQTKDEVDTSLKDDIDSYKWLPSGSMTSDQSLLYTFALEQSKDHPEVCK